MKVLSILIVLFPLLSKSQAYLTQGEDTAHNRYYTLLRAYLQGDKDSSVLPFLINTANELKEVEVVKSISRDYIDNYLLLENDKNLFTKDNIDFLKANIDNTPNQVFSFFYNNTSKVDRIMDEVGYARDVICFVIEKQDVSPMLVKSDSGKITPDWEIIRKYLAEKYDKSYADYLIVNAKVGWYGYKKKWDIYFRNVIDRVNKYGPFAPLIAGDDFKYNFDAWGLFQCSTNRSQLISALKWSDSAIAKSNGKNAEYIDTYANILYKLGRTGQAITYEKRAVDLDPKAKDIQDNLEKMKKGEKTWPEMGK
jgi:tetratricopeptide (TPR) repeat protein